jgi:hypothetical protein
VKKDENKVLDTNTTEERKPTLSEILKAEEAELKAKRKAEKAKRKKAPIQPTFSKKVLTKF